MTIEKKITHNYLVTSSIDRMAEKRKDAKWIDAQLRDNKTLVVPIFNDCMLLSHNFQEKATAIFPSIEIYNQIYPHTPPEIFLGQDLKKGNSYFAACLPVDDPEVEKAFSSLGRFYDLRWVAAAVSQEESALLAYAKAISYWHLGHQFCGWCGSSTQIHEGGHLRICANKKCGKYHFPRTDPAVIVLVTCKNKCLLGRSERFPKNMYSTLAGFVEPGESLEMTVTREVLEETGVKTKPAKVKYHSSQPWPFPSSLMLGFYVETEMQELNIDHDELTDAAWFSSDEISKRLDNGSLRLPSHYSIAFRLIQEWRDRVV